MNLSDKASKIKAIVLDIDGVLTNALIGYGGGHDGEIKFFNVRDGLAIKLAMRAGLKVGILSGRSSDANKRRIRELDLDFSYEGEKDKGTAFNRLLDENGLTENECLYIGDDLIDLPVLCRTGLSVVVADGAEELDEFCDFRTKNAGGYGAVRETITWLLKEQDKWDLLMEKYLKNYS